MIDIRPVQSDDLATLRKIAIETQVDTFGEFNTPENMDAFIAEAYNLSQFEKELNEPGSTYYIAWEGKEAAGFLRLRTTDEVKTLLGSNTLEIQRLYVTKHFLGKKVGARLMQHAINYARKRKFEWLWLGVWEHNIKAKAFYVKWGFERFSEHVFMLGNDPQMDWLMKLKL